MINYLFKKSCNWGPNILDWTRSLYFSVLGSSVLSLALKWRALSFFAFASYFSAIIFFLIGLRYSVIIANRFKQLEKDYDKDILVNKRTVHLHPDYLLLKDEKYKFQHFLLYTLWLPAICLLGYSGYYIENKASDSSSQSKDGLHIIEKKIESLDSAQQIMTNIEHVNKQFIDSFYIIESAKWYQEKQIDSLKLVIKDLKKANKPQPVQKH